MDNALQQFKNLVGIKFQLYNSLFTALPFHRIEKTGVLLSLFLIHCEEGYRKQQSPVDIINSFLTQYTGYQKEQEQIDLLFRFIQYSERQVVLFDALEDAAFKQVRDINGPGTLKQLAGSIIQSQKEEELADKLKHFCVRLVLTAHPTQFYPGSVLGIINDLGKALTAGDSAMVNLYLQQLGKTPFLQKQKPTPYDEAVSLIWYMENVFYQASGKILAELKSQFPHAVDENNSVFRLGFWPGGDRDGNPFVNAATTLKVADALRGSIMKCYYFDVRRLKRRLTFKGVEQPIAALETKLYNNLFIPGHQTDISSKELLQTLRDIRETLITQHNGLFLYMVDSLISKVQLFGLYFASLDIRQDSTVLTATVEAAAQTGALPANYTSLSDTEKINALLHAKPVADITVLKDALHKDTLETIAAIKNIQQYNGEAGCQRFIISHTTSALNVMEVYGLFLMGGYTAENLDIDIVPLFETVEDLQQAAETMRALYHLQPYREHLRRRNNTQTIMVGFSDGTKDGGYLMANWSIYKAKDELTRISRECDIDVVFFDGRGGPPARGGGKTHKFYASMGSNVANNEIQLTIQGQTISSNFGTVDSAQFNMEQLLNAGITNALFSPSKATLNEEEAALLQQLAEDSFVSYTALKNHPCFLEYLGHASPLRFYAETNIGSRPAKRNPGAKLSLNDLRAIPFVGAWSQLKQNVTGYYGVGAALKKMEEAGKWKEVKTLYQHSMFFKTLMDNCEMAMKKSFFPLTAFLSRHPKYGELWNMIYEEYELTKKYVLKLSGESDLMGDYPVDQLSIQMRERIVLPLVTIQQYGITKVRELEEKLITSPQKDSYEKLVMRCSFGIINAGRNSA
ncbi:phosphoenolpyruvate carboxylase [Deminuibacter soli]|uniref:Phosphoenolpyruvate carboxylase n=1 Tax=Deminuibacter soli TaxID=2291815 RepID=A0A3E1NIH2_9BACT|nr:phosphoenolpyruvate carboxylase [Deminuibacter soli]RFM27588.1 phosphoenolpyruvate carboxylase [Deminuibacter soli]